MIVPKFWAEGRIQERKGGRQVTVRRFGWSDESQADAQAKADHRTSEAFARIVAGESAPRREPKRAYNGAEGVPIREEIVDCLGETILTRNSYGALCLNTPNVLFADIDFEDESGCVLLLSIMTFLVATAVAIGWVLHSWLLGFIAVVAAIMASAPIAYKLQSLIVSLRGGAEQLAKSRIEKFLNTHPDWHLRLYRTPAGLRVLVMHKTFDPSDHAVAECFRALGADPIYVRMCLRQQCFRARVSPKPWRIGISQHLRPRPGIWPVDPARLPERRRWIEAYEQAAQPYASCRFIEAIGSGVVNPAVADVQRIHDELCQAQRALAIA